MALLMLLRPIKEEKVFSIYMFIFRPPLCLHELILPQFYYKAFFSIIRASVLLSQNIVIMLIFPPFSPYYHPVNLTNVDDWLIFVWNFDLVP